MFVSYAHVDNEPDRPDLDGKQGMQGWVDRFMSRFPQTLWKSLGEHADIWFDRVDIRDGDRFDPKIEQDIRGSGVLLVLLSPAYLNAEYCRLELTWFTASAQQSALGLAIDNQSRVRPILLHDVPFGQWPTQVQGMAGAKFYDIDSRQPLDPVHADDLFTEAIERLAGEVSVLLKAMKSLEPVPVKTPPRRPFRVYLAATSDTNARQKRRLASVLAERQVDVLGAATPVPPPYEREAHASRVMKELDGADLAVHLLDGLPGSPIEGALETSFPEEQCRLALRHPCAQLVILPEFIDLATVDELGYRDFLEGLEKGRIRKDVQGSPTLRVAKGRNDSAIIDLIMEVRQESQAATQKPVAAARSVFIDLQPRDLRLITDLCDFLDKQQLEAITISSSEHKPTESSSLFEQTLLKALAFFIVYGEVGREWVKSRVERAVQLIVRHELPFRPVVYVAGRAKTPAELVFSFCEVVDGTSGFSAEAVSRFLGRGGRG